MVSEMVVVLVMLPLVPVMVMVLVPVVALGEAFTVMVEVPEPAMEVGLKDMETPRPAPDAERLIDELNPPEAVALMVAVLEDFLATVRDVGEAERVKVLAVLVTVSATVVV